jgi:hypothetical protein
MAAPTSLQREESSCQPGAVHTWPVTTGAKALNLRSVLGVLRTLTAGPLGGPRRD